MSIRTLETAVLNEARFAFKNPKLRRKDLLEWSSGTATPAAGEVKVRLPLGIEVVVAKAHDKREVSK